MSKTGRSHLALGSEEDGEGGREAEAVLSCEASVDTNAKTHVRVTCLRIIDWRSEGTMHEHRLGRSLPLDSLDAEFQDGGPFGDLYETYAIKLSFNTDHHGAVVDTLWISSISEMTVTNSHQSQRRSDLCLHSYAMTYVTISADFSSLVLLMSFSCTRTPHILALDATLASQ